MADRGLMHISDLFDGVFSDLTYLNYACNRDVAPNITPQSWKKVYGQEVDEMEARYQAEKAIAKARA